MSHLIIGPGAMGRLLALRLAERLPVTLFGRRSLPHRQTLTTPEGEHHHRSLECLTPDSLDELDASRLTAVHLVTKAYSAEAALATVAPRLPRDTPLVLWQNGFDVQPRLTRQRQGPTLCATTTEGAYSNGDDSVVHAGHGSTWIGHLDGHHAELAATLAETLTGAGLPAQAVDDIRVRLWHKLAVNAAINPLVARFRVPNGQLRDPALHPMVDAVIEEVEAIMVAAAIPPPPRGFAALVWDVVAATADNRASMLQDILADRPTEHDAILMPLLRVARDNSLETPHLAALHQQLEARQRPGRA
ncbi:ketopantoate reductase family protein [Halomonas elongata]|uniref:2-dehydropantoate 2-reductase n=1 Tax=Halomonas elongata (strain ATCC 33173 / DSM 2581 / NBRC 15536 / NCIMB 2198 / 1H9) TaxID=768066 RepID=E1VBC3_HALED|nr:ketopantoate reductase family protein [Halomonas elongata]WBF19452.1 ketopantoate reductase family protein [Halomonas elongata]WPU48313.1 ketopantoate reductase family protein [Halomonas elongata DSM 2581]CBV42184.1 2-dehydropantoate 2-reductase [Halomonas elongata DSM 2581]